MGVSILINLAAKEIMINTMDIFYQADLHADESSSTLKENRMK